MRPDNNARAGRMEMAATPYVGYKFIGVKPFTASLEESGTGYVTFEADPGIAVLFDARPEFFNRDTDSIVIGKCTGGNIDAYFAEFGLKITKTFRSYIVFIYNHHPDTAELLATADMLETVVSRNLASVDPSGLTGDGLLH